MFDAFDFIEFAINSMENILFLLLVWNAYLNQVFFRQYSATSWQFQSLKNDIFHFGETVNVGKTSPDGPDILPLVCLAVVFDVRTFSFLFKVESPYFNQVTSFSKSCSHGDHIIYTSVKLKSSLIIECTLELSQNMLDEIDLSIKKFQILSRKFSGVKSIL